MDIKEFAQNIVDLDRKNPSTFNEKTNQYSKILLKNFMSKFNQNKKDELSPEEISHIKQIIHKIEPELLIFLKKMTIESTGHLHKVTYNYTYPSTNRILFFTDEILIKSEEYYEEKYFNTFFPMKDGIYFTYDADVFKKEKNVHQKMDYKFKLNQFPEYTKINYLIYILEQMIHFETYTLYHPNEQFLRDLLQQIFAVIILGKDDPLQLFKDDIQKIKDILQKREYPYNRERKVDLKDAYHLIKLI